MERAAESAAPPFPAGLVFDAFSLFHKRPEQPGRCGAEGFELRLGGPGGNSAPAHELQGPEDDGHAKHRLASRDEGTHQQQRPGNQLDDGMAAELVDQHEAGQEGAENRAEGAPGVDISDGAACFLAERQGEAGSYGRDCSQRDRRQQKNPGDDENDPQLPADPFRVTLRGRPLIEPEHAEGEQSRGEEQPGERFGGGITVGQPTTQEIAHAESREDDPDHAGPGVERGPQVLGDQSRGGKFEGHDADARREDDRIAEHAAGATPPFQLQFLGRGAHFAGGWSELAGTRGGAGGCVCRETVGRIGLGGGHGGDLPRDRTTAARALGLRFRLEFRDDTSHGRRLETARPRDASGGWLLADRGKPFNPLGPRTRMPPVESVLEKNSQG